MTTALVAGTAAVAWQAVRATQAEARAEARAEETGMVLEYLVEDVFGAAQPERSQGRALTIEQLLTKGEQSIAGRFARRPLVEASARMAMGDGFKSLGRPVESQRQFRRAVEIRAHLLGPEHPDTLAAQALLVNAMGQEAYQSHHFKPEAELLARRVLEARSRALGPDHPATLHSVDALGGLLRHMGCGKYEEALGLIKRAYSLRARVLGPDHLDTLKTLDNMAATLPGLGRHAEALETYPAAPRGAHPRARSGRLLHDPDPAAPGRRPMEGRPPGRGHPRDA